MFLQVSTCVLAGVLLPLTTALVPISSALAPALPTLPTLHVPAPRDPSTIEFNGEMTSNGARTALHTDPYVTTLSYAVQSPTPSPQPLGPVAIGRAEGTSTPQPPYPSPLHGPIVLGPQPPPSKTNATSPGALLPKQSFYPPKPLSGTDQDGTSTNNRPSSDNPDQPPDDSDQLADGPQSEEPHIPVSTGTSSHESANGPSESAGSSSGAIPTNSTGKGMRLACGTQDRNFWALLAFMGICFTL